MTERNKFLLVIFTLSGLLAICITYIVKQRKDFEPLEQRVIELTQSSRDSINSYISSQLKGFDAAETVIDNTKTIVRREQEIKNEYISNVYLINALDSAGIDSLFGVTMLKYRERDLKGWYDGK
jgi:ABC-type microcin C transport system permease subunit YejB